MFKPYLEVIVVTAETPQPRALEALTLTIPDALLKYDWEQAIEANEGEARRLLMICKQQTEALGKCRNWDVTPEGVAWLLLWTRNFNILQSAVSLLQADQGVLKAGQVMGLLILWRSAFELHLTLNYIWSEKAEALPAFERAPVAGELNFAERLCAYLAWCLWNDYQYHHKLTQGWRTDALVSPSAEAGKDEQMARLALEFLWGDEGPAVEEPASRTKRRIRSDALTDRSRSLKWLEHSRLARFVETLKQERPSTFFGLVAPGNTSIARLMQNTSDRTDAAYPLYQRASALLHGGTADQHLWVAGDRLLPRFIATDEEIQAKAAHVRRFCHFNARALERMVIEVGQP